MRVTKIHGITDRMVRGQPTESQVLPRFFDFLSAPNTILLAHNAVFDIGFISFAAARVGINLPPTPIIDTLEVTRACVRGSRTHRLEDLAIHLRVAESEEHRALSDCRLVKGVLQKILTPHGRIQNVRDLYRIASPFDPRCSEVVVAGPPAGFEQLAVAIDEDRDVLIRYQKRATQVVNRTITPRAMVQSSGRTYLIAFCHSDRIDKTYRLDRIQEFTLLNQ
jgi:DNA polymerase III epsilon subunit-like protein